VILEANSLIDFSGARGRAVDAIKAANPEASTSAQPEDPKAPEHPCPCCGGRMRIIEAFLPGQQPKHRSTPLAPKIRIDTS
jgi:hypothetical protein